MKIWTHTFLPQTLTLRAARRHRRTLYFQTTVASEREVRCAKLIVRHVSALLNGASLVSPHSEVTLSFMSAPQMNRALCQVHLRSTGQSVRPPCLLNVLFTIAPHSAGALRRACEHSTPCITAQKWAQIKNQCLIPPSASGPLILAPVGMVAIAACVT